MIERLEDTPILNQYGDCLGMRQPSTMTIVEKINEIIDYLNDKEKDEKKNE